jgi:hypothetical protein
MENTVQLTHSPTPSTFPGVAVIILEAQDAQRYAADVFTCRHVAYHCLSEEWLHALAQYSGPQLMFRCRNAANAFAGLQCGQD